MAPGKTNNNKPLDPADAAVLEVYQEIERLRAETGPGGCRKIIVFKMRADRSKNDRCRQFASGELDIDQLPVLFGGGDFTLELIDEKNKYLRRFPVSFSTDVYPAIPTPTPPATPGAGPAGVLPGGSIQEFITEMRAEAKQAQDRHMHFMETIITAILGGQKPVSLKDQVEQLVALKSLSGDGDKPNSSLIADAIKMGLDLAANRSPGDAADDAGGDPDETSPTMRVIERIVDKVMADTRRPTRPPPPPEAGRREPAAAAPPTPPDPLPPELEQYAWLGKFAPYLTTWARTQFPVERAANVILEFVQTDEHMEMLEKFVRMAPNVRNPILIRINGSVAPYGQFINDLCADLVKKFETEFESEPGGEFIDATEPKADPAKSA